MTTTHPHRPNKIWIIVLITSIALLAFVWSIDVSFVYVLLGVAVFALFQIIRNAIQHQHKNTNHDAPPRHQQFNSATEPKQKTSLSLSPKQFARIIVAFVVVMFIFIVGIIITTISDSENVDDHTRAWNFYNQQQYDSANYYYRKAIQHDPQNEQLIYDRANTFYYLQHYDSARILYQQAIDLNPEYYDARYMLGFIYYEKKNFREAIQLGRGIIRDAPTYTDAYLLTGDCYYSQQAYDSALVYYEDVHDQGYRSAPLCHIMGYIYDTQGKQTLAIEHYKEALAMDSTKADVAIRLGELLPGTEGEVYRKLGNGSDASEW